MPPQDTRSAWRKHQCLGRLRPDRKPHSSLISTNCRHGHLWIQMARAKDSGLYLNNINIGFGADVLFRIVLVCLSEQ